MTYPLPRLAPAIAAAALMLAGLVAAAAPAAAFVPPAAPAASLRLSADSTGRPHASLHRADWKNPGFYPVEPPRREYRPVPRLPRNCAIEVRGERYAALYYTEDCLRRAGLGHGLPRHCARQVRTQGYVSRVYEAACLREAGFRIGRLR